MTSKERVLKTINHTEPDRVPVGEFGIDHDHVSRIIGRPTYWRNRKETTLALWDGRRDDVVQSCRSDYDELIKKLDYDIIPVEIVPPKNLRYTSPPKKIAENTWQDKAGIVYKYAASNDSIQCVTAPANKELILSGDFDFYSKRYRAAPDESVFELIDYFGDKYGKEKAVLVRSIDIFGCLMAPFGGDYNHRMIMTALEPEQIKSMHDISLEYNKRIIEHCAAHNVLIAMQGDDFCMNTGPPAP